MNVIVIHEDETWERKNLPGENMLRELQAEVGGDIQSIRIKVFAKNVPNFIMIVNEEGHLKRMGSNPVATLLLSHGEIIAGSAVICKEGIVDGEPDFVGLDAIDLDFIEARCKREATYIEAMRTETSFYDKRI